MSSNRLAVDALRGLRTRHLYLFPRRPFQHKPWKRALHFAKIVRTTAPFVRRQLVRIGYGYDVLVTKPAKYYLDLVGRVCGEDPEIGRLMDEKVPSVGVLAVAIGLAEHGYERIVLSGFSFEITHAYAVNPLIEARGSALSRHADTDIAALQAIQRRHGCLATTEAIVHERTGIPLFGD